MKEHLSLHERIRNAASSQEVENVKAIHSYLHGRADAASEWSLIWSKTEDVSWAHGFGRMRGRDQVWFGCVGDYDKMCMENWLEMFKTYPEVCGKDPRPLMECSVHTLVTDVIEVADDGMSARGSFITPGVIHSVLTPEQKKYCNILWERYGADFVFEDGQWKYLHEHVCPDIPTSLDCANWAAEDYRRQVSPPPDGAHAPPAPPHIADPGPMHRDYTCLSKPQNTCPWPEPYKTLDNNNTYTPLTYTTDEGKL